MIRRLSSAFLCASALFVACTDKEPAAPAPPQPPSPPAPVATPDDTYEAWTQQHVHLFRHGIGFDIGAPEGDKYLEWNGAWLSPEWISQETAEAQDMRWAADRFVRWLSGTTATFSFPIDPKNVEGDLTLRLLLRPKVNDTVSVKFYQTDDPQKTAWTPPETLKLKPGWNNSEITIPRTWLNKDGNQLMRLTFPGSFFEGEQRVSAKFMRIELATSPTAEETRDRKDERTPAHKLMTSACRVDDAQRLAWITASDDAIERYVIVPDDASLQWDMAPSPWLMAEAQLTVTVYTDGDAPAVLLDKTIGPGDTWTHESLSLSDYAQKAARIVLKIASHTDDHLFPALGLPRDALCISEPRLTVRHDDALHDIARLLKEKAGRIIVLGIDNLRMDRLLLPDTENVTPNFHALLAHAAFGQAMAESLFGSSTTATLLTGKPLPEHDVSDDTRHLRTAFQTLAEKHETRKSFFYTTSNTIEPSRGFAQGFQVTRRLNKERLGSPALALQALAEAVSTAPDDAFFYLHLGTLRLPLQPSEANFERFRVKDYTGPVNAQAMNNVAVMKNPAPDDKRQFAAYYDAALADVDQAMAELIQRLPQNTLLFLYGTHASSLGESTLGYQQTMAPWEVMIPWILYHKDIEQPVQIHDIRSIADLHHTLDAILSPKDTDTPQTIFNPHPSYPISYGNGVAATASQKYFYRIRREGVDALFEWGDDETPLQTKELKNYPITRRALREQMAKPSSIAQNHSL